MSSNRVLNDIAEVIMGQSPKGENVNSDGSGFPLLNGPTEFTSRYPKPVQYTTEGQKFSEAGDILFCVRGSTTGRMNYADQSYAIGRGIAAIRGKNGYPTPYVRAVIEKNLDKLLVAATGSTFPNVGRDLILNFAIETVSPEDSIPINNLIVSLEEKIELNRQTNQTLEQIAQALFKSWFVDFEPTRAKIAAKQNGQDPQRAAMVAISGKSLAELDQLSAAQQAQLNTTAALFPDTLVDSELGEIPEGWEVGSIGDIASAKGGYAFKGKSFIDTGNPVVKIKNITGDGRVDLANCQCIDNEQAKNAKRFKLNDGNLLMAMTGATVAKIGLVVTGDKAAYLNQRVAKFESEKFGSKISWFLYCCFQRDNIFESVVGAAQGSAQPNISSSGIESVELILARSELIKLFCNSVDSLFNRWISNINQNSNLEQLRDSLLPKLLSGELAVNDMPATLEKTA